MTNLDHKRTESSSGAEHGLHDLFDVPLMDAILDRRTRRIARGTSISAGPLSHTSTNRPAPLSPLEEAILIVCTGLTGKVTMHDVPLEAPGAPPQFSTPLLKVTTRSASSIDNCQAVSFFMINDEGTWLLRHSTKSEVAAVLNGLPGQWADWTPEHWLKAAAAAKQKVYDTRLDFPRQWPYYFIWNREISNRPGTTLFFPVVDLTRQNINVLLSLLSELDGQRPLFIDDWQKFRPKTLLDWGAWFGSLLGLVPKIPYQIIGGAKRAQGSFLNRNYPVPLGLASTMRTDYEALFQIQNLMLVAHSMGLGGWIHASTPSPYVFERDPSKGTFGLAFRMQQPKNWRRWPPLPAPLPNPVGLDGVLEALCPPYVKSMDEAVDAVVGEKYGPAGAYGNEAVFSRAYRERPYGREFIKNAGRATPEAIEYAKEICNYVYDTYGRFPAHVNAFHVPGVWIQFSHLELEYYRKYFEPSLYQQQARHAEIWGES